MSDFHWGERSVAIDESIKISLGQLKLEVARGRRDWTVEYTYELDRYVNESSKAITRIRTAVEEATGVVMLSPRVADRNVVAMPVQTLRIPAGGQAMIYISTPVWLRIGLGPEGEIELLDGPAEILSDTWFGPNTREGELCYSNATQARMYRELLPDRIDRIVTPVSVSNEGSDIFSIDRVNLPMPLLSVYRADDSLWTQQISVTRTEDVKTARVKLEEEAPDHVSDASLVAPPREVEDSSVVSRALGILFR